MLKDEKRLHDSEYCFECGAPATDVHHLCGGRNRENSEKYGLTVCLCRACHDRLTFHDTGMEERYKRMAQIAFEYKHSRAAWMAVFGKNYL